MALNLGSEKRINMNGDDTYIVIRGGFCVLIRKDNSRARVGLIRDHQLAMPGLFNVMKYIWHALPPFADEKNT